MKASWDQIQHSICSTWEEAFATCEQWRTRRECIVFTNGCFDLLHPGHIRYLSEAADCGDRLIVGLNNDHSVRMLKGEDRPVQSEHDRASMLASLRMVDAVVYFEEATPLELIKYLRPDVLVKGGDYTTGQIVGADVVIAEGGKVFPLHFVEGYSTSSIIDKIRAHGHNS